MKTTLMIVLCSAAILASGYATSHSCASAWEYKSATTYPEGVDGQVTAFAKQGWSFVAMTGASKSPSDPIEVVLLFKRHKCDDDFAA
jgi:hypothetical protein